MFENIGHVKNTRKLLLGIVKAFSLLSSSMEHFMLNFEENCVISLKILSKYTAKFLKEVFAYETTGHVGQIYLCVLLSNNFGVVGFM